MEEEKNSDFRVTDRRKFNPDGTPREESAETEPTPTATEQAKPQAEEPSPEVAEPDNAEPDNVVSFPGEAAKKREQAEAERNAQSNAQPDQSAAERAESIKAAASAAEQAYNQTKSGRPTQLPEASFLALADMLAGEAAMCLGLAQAPDGNKLPVDLETARHMIDMLGMLEQKTKGNLTAEEDSVLENVLAYLRMQFVALSRRQ
ncbi:MAG TPA: DUF1844 domain-containing protein [Blastocatellia bacterium]|nr:DUF1844 domain-containing protein [Blastocatellia bacterium]